MSLKERLYRFRSFWIFPFIAAFLLAMAFRNEPQARSSDLVWLFLLGVLIWTLLEYALHRFVFHIQIPMQNAMLKQFVNAPHLAHHAAPRDPEKILVRP